MLRVTLFGLVLTWGLSLTRLVRSWRIPAPVSIGVRRAGWPGAVRQARG